MFINFSSKNARFETLVSGVTKSSSIARLEVGEDIVEEYVTPWFFIVHYLVSYYRTILLYECISKPSTGPSSPIHYKLNPFIPQSNLPTLPTYYLTPDFAHNLGSYSSRYPVPSNISSDLPHGCSVTMVSVLQRHGARYPAEDAGEEMQAISTKLKRAAAWGITEPSLQFVSAFNFSYLHDQLVPFGRAQSYISGQIIANKYSSLGNMSFWKQGFEGKPFEVDMFNLPQPDLVIPIEPSQNNTLGVKTCPAQVVQPPPGFIAQKKWLSVFALPITRRLNGYLPGANLVDDDISNLMSLCGFDTAAKGGIASPWCGVFEGGEWKSYEYYNDLEKYYTSSYGSSHAPSEGAGWVNELLARLTNTPVQDKTTTNRSLDSSLKTFPIGPEAPRVFADFSSNHNIMKIIAAIGILRDLTNLPQRTHTIIALRAEI
ncbi:unnamed protein product [Rhizoctonia solani]|uniref:3-phytase n=1 Tax=Rhizoctonia solani TaxID=456999 RepID=A0A8H3CFS7_9AGAM|nr:unnamed protein product [Rhizoctonia solani]